ncbi:MULTISPECIES: FeoA family protein [Sediminispirochaeta]|jgi:ferrous iron transport protein A|uniref:FeoA family protein n=1 Tax=Sediminispirochaeta smaragdinae (strain DSM 11293 / JCM 15392 / SEBR 4228) TaxID=573413 RepID=E1R2L9_SEDSS|nr:MULTISPECIES: FeoA family protein [Sediminispirochaeta]ADK82579.1 FeoA family protein [Sediminispirochaeta smaragdinae DSM 11293]
MCTLDRLSAGCRGVIDSLQGGNGFISRVSAIGFTPDTVVTMVSRRGRGPVLVWLRDSEVALGRGEAAKITVREVL